MLKPCMRFVAPLAFLAACSGGSSERTRSGSSALSGPIDVRVVAVVDGDETPPATTATSIVVTITRVDARVDDPRASFDDDWVTLSVATKTVDLLALPAGGFASLGVTQLPAGGVERLRIFVSDAGPNYVVTADGQRHTLVVPSDAIQVVGDFDVEDCATGSVTLAFAGKKSLQVHPLAGATDTWVLRPVIRVREATLQNAQCEDDDDQGKGHGEGAGEQH
jgi:hypothetical protein